MKRVLVMVLGLMMVAGAIYAGPASNEKSWGKLQKPGSKCEPGYRLPKVQELREGNRAGVITDGRYSSDSGAYGIKNGKYLKPKYNADQVRCIR